jgi:GT2 family glycosyltransferase
MGIAVVVLTHNRRHLLEKCVSNVLAVTSDATTEVVIWDNGSTDGTAAYLRTLRDERFRIVEHPRNIGQNAYAEAFKLTDASHLVELDDDVIDAPAGWDRTLLDAFERLPRVGFLAADLEDDEHDLAAHVRYRVRPHEYVEDRVNGVRLLRGPTGGGCAMTSRAIYDEVGGFRQHRKLVFWSEEAAYIDDIKAAGYEAAVLADLKVRHAGGPYYSAFSAEKAYFWAREERIETRKNRIKRALLLLPFVRRLNRRYAWFVEPGGA